MRLDTAIDIARQLAADGPRVASVIAHPTKGYKALPGYTDADSALPKGYTTLHLVTPDGRLWITEGP
jgi:hypothetical protein